MPSIAYFIGIIVIGSSHKTDGDSFNFDVEKVLGNGFVVNPDKGIILTCEHVLPKEDRCSGSEFAFFVYDSNMNLKAFIIDPNSAVQWAQNDVIALKIINPIGLNSFPINESEIHLAIQVITVGIPLNHFSSRAGENVVTPRALVSNVVSCYQDECEIDKPFIITMSGSPVLIGETIIGIATMNREYAINQYLTERIEQSIDGRPISKEIYQYDEVARFGVFSKASSWKKWLDDLYV